jgi:chromosome segregation ATPase
MPKGIDISVAADTRAAMSGIQRGVIDPLTDASELLEKLGDKSDDATRQLEDGMRDAQRRTDSAKDEIADLRDEITRAGRAGKSAGDDIDDGFRKAEQGAEEFKDEANSTAREAAASFDGSAESIADMFQETAANAFVGFGPAGAVAGLAAAAGIGLAVKGFEDMGLAQEASEEAASEWANAYIEAGGRVLTSAVTTARALEIITDTEGRFKEAQENAKNWGVEVGTAVAAMAGETWALNAAQQSLADRSAEAARRLAEQETQVDSSAGAAYDLGDAVEAGQRSMEKLTGEMEAGSQRADAYSQYLAEMAANTEGATREVDEFGDAVYSLPDGSKVYVDAETGQATSDIDAIERKIYSTDGMQATVHVNARVNRTAVDDLIWQLRNNTFDMKVRTQGSRAGVPFA